jgi:hypothetical protein
MPIRVRSSGDWGAWLNEAKHEADSVMAARDGTKAFLQLCVEVTMAASEALRNQVSAKWQDSFNRLNRGAGGISGLMEFSKVRVDFVFLNGVACSKTHLRTR